jgi:hypothetical protein
MLRIDKNEKKLVRLNKMALADADHWERQLQAMIWASPDAFCEEIGESLWVIGQEVRPSDAVPDRIDILAVDKLGNSVVMELKRGTHKLQLLQALSYAGMVSRWAGDQFVETLSSSYRQETDDARADIEEHTGSDISNINQAQRIMLVAEDFDPALLIAAEWLHESFGVDIRCYRLQLSQENSVDYITCTCVYPPIEIATLTRSGEISSTPAWASWDEALASVDNAAVKEFVRKALESKKESRLQYRDIIYRVGGKRRFFISCKRKYAYVWQRGRFDGDSAYWKKVLSEPSHVLEVSEKRSLRFHLTTAADFTAFGKAMEQDLQKVDFVDNTDSDQPPDQE